MKISTKWEFGQILYLKTDIDQMPGIITEITCVPGSIMYTLSFGGDESSHYEFELTEREDVVLKTSR